MLEVRRGWKEETILDGVEVWAKNGGFSGKTQRYFKQLKTSQVLRGAAEVS